MKKSTSKKLQLSRITLNRLDKVGVVGAAKAEGSYTLCTSLTVPSVVVCTGGTEGPTFSLFPCVTITITFTG